MKRRLFSILCAVSLTAAMSACGVSSEVETIPQSSEEAPTSVTAEDILSSGNYPVLFEDASDIMDRYPAIVEGETKIPPTYVLTDVLWYSTNSKTKHVDSIVIHLDKTDRDYTLEDALALADTFISDIVQYYDIEDTYGVQDKDDPENNQKEYRIEYTMKGSALDTIGAQEIDRSPVYSKSFHVEVTTDWHDPNKLMSLSISTSLSSQYSNLRIQGRERFEWQP